MLYTAILLLLTGAMASAAATYPSVEGISRALRKAFFVVLAAFCLGLALLTVFPSGPWLYPAALSINGAACVAHGILLTTQFRVLSGFCFSVLGGMQLGLVLILASVAGAKA